MNELVIIGYEFCSVAFPALIVYGVLQAGYRKNGIKRRRGQILLLLVMMVYVTGVFHFTGVGTIYHIRQYELRPDITYMNLIPFSAAGIDVVSYLLNIVLLIPLGFLLPLIWPEQNRFRSALCFGVAASLVIEISQLLNIRNTDIDDILMNTLGTIAGFLLFRLFARLTKREERPAAGYPGEAILYLASMCIGHFLMFNEMGAAKILYGV